MARHREFDKDKALEKAMEVFWLKGYEATSIRDLVEAMDIHRGSMYDTFGDKHALYVASLQRYTIMNQERIAGLFKHVDSTVKALSIFFQDMIDETPENRDFGCFINNAMVELASRDTSVAEITSQNAEFMVSTFTTLLKRGQEQGEIRRDKDAEALAQYLLSSIQGIKVMVKNNSSAAMLRNIVDVTLLAVKA